MPEFRYINLGENINSAVTPELQDGTWLIYPTERSCREAMALFQEHWQPLSISFLSMDEFKQKVIYSNQIRLQDEKRLVCLYQAMTAEDKAVFHIEKYPDLIDWGQHFFSFLEELAEECVDAENLLKRMVDNDFSYQQWQLENYQRMLAIRNQYQDFITAKGYTDFIFDQHISNLHLPLDTKRYVFVNQYYYTKLEQTIIEQIEAKNKQVIIFYQGCREWLNEETLKSAEFPLEEAFPQNELPFKLKLYQSQNAWQIALSFLQNQNSEQPKNHNIHFIIDGRFLQQAYSKVFDKTKYQHAEPQPMHQTKLCHFFQIWAKGLENLIFDKGKRLIKLDWLLQAIGMDGFIAYFRPEWDERQLDKFTAFICRFSENDVLYLDTGLEIIKLKPFENSAPECVDLLKVIMALLIRLAKTNSIRNMIEIIDSKDGISIKDLLSDEEKHCSNLLESFYEGLANFMSMDELALVKDWQSLYPNMEVSAGILDLFMTFIKPKTYRFYFQDVSKPTATVTNLMDTRNLQAEKVTFLNLVEGELPGGREAVWLFNEKQRKAIGLKTWEDIRNWERYYFYRILASAKEVELYTIFSQDKNIEPSSFMNELTLFTAGKEGQEKPDWQPAELSADTLLLNWLRTEQENPLSEEVSTSEIDAGTFFYLPFDQQFDLGANQRINLSWSACEHFIKNPFLYYLRDLKRLRERTVRQDETMGRKMFGTMLHKYLNVITKRLAEQHDGVLSMKWEWISREFLSNNLKAALADPLLYFQIPRNYNQEYLKELLTPFLIETASWFFRVGLAKTEDFQNEFITIIPETDSLTDYERRYKLLIKSEDNQHEIAIAIRGRADLRLETKSKRFIIDFKTGESDALQLMFYMWFYYLIEQPELSPVIRAAIYKLMDKQLEWLDYKAKPDPSKLIAKINDALDSMVQTGYAPAATVSQRRYYIDITRADLLRGISTEKETE